MPRLTPEQVEKAHWTLVKPGEAIVPLPGTMEVTPSPWVVFTVTNSPANDEATRGCRCAIPADTIEAIVELGESVGIRVRGQALPIWVVESLDELLGLPPARTNEEE